MARRDTYERALIDSGLVAHDFPLRPDLSVRFYLPPVLTIADAERLSRIVTALVMPEGSDDGG